MENTPPPAKVAEPWRIRQLKPRQRNPGEYVNSNPGEHASSHQVGGILENTPAQAKAAESWRIRRLESWGIQGLLVAESWRIRQLKRRRQNSGEYASSNPGEHAGSSQYAGSSQGGGILENTPARIMENTPAPAKVAES